MTPTQIRDKALEGIEPCPICGSKPDIDECDIPGTGWYANCYKAGYTPQEEHFIGVNASCRAEAIALWNAHVRSLKSLNKETSDET